MNKKILLGLTILLSFIVQLSLSFSRNQENEEKILIVKLSSKKDYEILNRLNGKILKELNLVNATLVKIKASKVNELLNQGIKIYENKKVRAFLHESSGIIFADYAWDMNITGEDVKICILDSGVDYKHEAIDNCESVEFLNGNIENYTLESPHPYPANYNYTWIITRPNFTRISVHFVNISVEKDYDFLYIKDKNDNIVQTFNGNYEDVWSVSVPGDTIKINLVSDWYMSWYGFYIDKIINGSASKNLENCTRILAAYDFVNEDYDPLDDNGHGTHVAGIIGSRDSYSRGIAYGSKLLIGKVLNSNGEGTYSDVINGIEWCINNSANIISLSLGGDLYTGNCDDDLLAQAVNSAVDKGITVVVSAGNSGACGISTPACASKAIAVGAVDKNKNVVGFSSRGSELDLLAPGDSINSTYIGNTWKRMSGTSMSAPHVSGAVALLLQVNPSLSPFEIKNLLKESAYPPEKCFESYRIINGRCTNVPKREVECNSEITGSGIINISKALELLSNSKRVEPLIEFLINDDENNITVGDNENVTINVRILIGDGEASVLENGTLIGLASPVFSISKRYYPGVYNITVYYPGYLNYLPYSKTLFIFVNDVTSPKINLLSPANRTYYTVYSTVDIKLEFSVNEDVSWIGYSLDNNENVTIDGNTTLNVGLGSHKIILYAKDLSGNFGSSDEVFFYVKRLSGGGGWGRFYLLN